LDGAILVMRADGPRQRKTLKYRLVHKDMFHPRLMKLNRTNINGNCLSFDLISIVLADFLNLPHLSLKYAIQFLLIQTPQNVFQALKN
jgi:hypothetical protein